MRSLLQPVTQEPPSPDEFPRRALLDRRRIGWILYLGILGALFAKPLYALTRYALGSDLYSYIILVPLTSIYLLWLKREELTRCRGGSSSAIALVPALAALAALVAYWVMGSRGWKPTENDYLSIMIFSFVGFVIAGVLFFFGRNLLRTVAFPVGFLAFMVPLPVMLTDGIEAFLQHSSANAAEALLALVGATVFRDGLVFRLPGITIEVAKECSGIHSSLVLFLTSLVAGQLFLRSPWKKTILALAVIPLGIARNGVRIFTIAMLCVHVDPSMIQSPIHTRGGPIFFVLSLVPFLALMFLLRKSEGLAKGPRPAIADPRASKA
jgi:exosortase C (VPDSG-CTERM-specific)